MQGVHWAHVFGSYPAGIPSRQGCSDLGAHDLWEWLNKRYTLQNTASKWATIISVDEISYASCKKMVKYLSEYYALKASISGKKVTIEDALKIRMLNNLGSFFETNLTVVSDRMRTNTMLTPLNNFYLSSPRKPNERPQSFDNVYTQGDF